MFGFAARFGAVFALASSVALVVLIGGRLAHGEAGGQSQAGWVELFNGKDLSGWQGMEKAAVGGGENLWHAAGGVTLDTANVHRFTITPGEGILVNGPKGKACNLHTELKHGDCEAHIEFTVPKGSNSGVYFMGKYEIQVFDSFGKEKVKYDDCGGIYGRWINNETIEGHAPRVNASKAPGEWQTFDVIFRAPRFDASGKKVENARFVKVVHNGQVVHEDVELKGETRACMPGPEQVRGPLMLQGDHGPVAYRNLRIRLMD
jgi:hypothetical protein